MDNAISMEMKRKQIYRAVYVCCLVGFRKRHFGAVFHQLSILASTKTKAETKDWCNSIQPFKKDMLWAWIYLLCLFIPHLSQLIWPPIKLLWLILTQSELQMSESMPSVVIACICGDLPGAEGYKTALLASGFTFRFPHRPSWWPGFNSGRGEKITKEQVPECMLGILLTES